MPVLELDQNKKITTSYLYGADGVVYRRKHNAVAHWHFDEGSGTTAHDVDGANHGTLGGGEEAKVPAWSFGCGLLFDGVDDLVKVPDSDALDLAGDKMTITAWVNRSSAGSGYLVKKSGASNGYQLWITATGTVQFDLLFNGTTKTVTSTTTLPVNQWKHIAARYDGTELRLFIDGTKESATTAATGSLAATTKVLWLGSYNAKNHHLHGYLDDLSIYNRALSNSEITDLVNDVDKRYEYHHVNALGSNIVSTDDNQNVLVRYEYDVFGAIRSETDTSADTRKFTGKEFDADSNLYYCAARYYDPYIGRFTQRDPIGDGVNWYAYTYNNPLKFIDPTGLQTEAPRPLSPLEAEAINFMFQGSINPAELRIQITHMNTGRGSYNHSQKLIRVSEDLYDAAGLSANSTASAANVLSPAVIDYLSTVVHEAMHSWGREYGGFDGYRVSLNGKVVYGFNFDQLGALDLAREQSASAVASAFILKWQLDHGAEVIHLDFVNFRRLRSNAPPDLFGNPFGKPVATLLGGRVDRIAAGRILRFFKPLMYHVGS